MTDTRRRTLIANDVRTRDLISSTDIRILNYTYTSLFTKQVAQNNKTQNTEN